MLAHHEEDVHTRQLTTTEQTMTVGHCCKRRKRRRRKQQVSTCELQSEHTMLNLVCGGQLVLQGVGKLIHKCPPMLLTYILLEAMEYLQRRQLEKGHSHHLG